jgi:hypothetical protein
VASVLWILHKPVVGMSAHCLSVCPDADSDVVCIICYTSYYMQYWKRHTPVGLAAGWMLVV